MNDLHSLVLLNYAGSTEVVHKIVFTLNFLKVPQCCYKSALFQARPLLPCFSSIHVLCSVFKVQKKERTHCSTTDAVAQYRVPSKLNNVRDSKAASRYASLRLLMKLAVALRAPQ